MNLGWKEGINIILIFTDVSISVVCVFMKLKLSKSDIVNNMFSDKVGYVLIISELIIEVSAPCLHQVNNTIEVLYCCTTSGNWYSCEPV